MRTALKEWAVLIDALARGDIIAMVRKGGIREQRAGFAVRHERFAFYPTYFHEAPAGLAPRFVSALSAADAARPPADIVRIAHIADVAATWFVTDLEALRAIGAEHGLAWPAVESRFHYRGTPGVHVIALRVSRLPHPAELPERRRYAGCVSWLQLDEDLDVTGAMPCLPVAELRRRTDGLRAALGAPESQLGESAA